MHGKNIPTVPTVEERSESSSIQPVVGKAIGGSKVIGMLASASRNIERVVWQFPFGETYVALDTPKDITPELWEKLNAYLQVIKPAKGKPNDDKP